MISHLTKWKWYPRDHFSMSKSWIYHHLLHIWKALYHYFNQCDGTKKGRKKEGRKRVKETKKERNRENKQREEARKEGRKQARQKILTPVFNELIIISLRSQIQPFSWKASQRCPTWAFTRLCLLYTPPPHCPNSLFLLHFSPKRWSPTGIMDALSVSSSSISSSLDCTLLRSSDSCQFCSLLCIQCLEDCLALTRCSLNI